MRWLARIVVTIVAIILVALGAVFVDDRFDQQTLVKRVRNDKLETIKPDWPGNGIDQRDRFMDERHPYIPTFLKLLKWRFGPHPLKEAKQNDTWRVDVRDPQEFLSSGRDGIMWLGHASFYIRIGGVGILTDPVFGDPMFLKRVVPVPSQLDAIKGVDYVLLSHDHRDHMDENSIRQIATKYP
ncbi:MAG: MBL fold metallo-hydrolase, partial [Acidobacteria bacterium]|nr:MBL fold metallo-hydrolase [Acidobacteriota bacterium]